MKRIYVDVDTQFDFCDLSGALFVPGASDAAVVWKRLVAHAAERGDIIVGSVDSHTHEAWEFKTNANVGPHGEKPNFPPHCVKGTRGWLKLPETLPARFAFVGMDAIDVHLPARSQAVYFEKEVYSLFANRNAAAVLDAFADAEAVEFVVFGVATDYCVRAAALGLVEWAASRSGRVTASTVTVVRDGVSGIACETIATAMREMSAAGVKFADSAEVLSR